MLNYQECLIVIRFQTAGALLHLHCFNVNRIFTASTYSFSNRKLTSQPTNHSTNQPTH